jgi:nitrite reductase/ring-hydroxylating ferredoxin subunit
MKTQKMYRILAFLTLITTLIACNRDNDAIQQNPYLPDYNFEITLNLNLPQYNNLQFPSNGVFIDAAGVGIRGIFVFNAGSGNFTAFDAACPNQALQSCSTMTLNGIMAVCPCDNAEYSLFTGLANGKQYSLKPYRIQVINSTTLNTFNLCFPLSKT